jgi:23S rRNA pseudouridine1911/1915/1917 synthase
LKKISDYMAHTGHDTDLGVIQTDVKHQEPPLSNSLPQLGEGARSLPSPDLDFEDTEMAALPERRVQVLERSFHGMRLDRAVVCVVPEFSRNHLQTLIEQGHVQLNGTVACSASRKVLAGQQLSVDLVPTPESRAFKAQAMQLDCVFEDAHVMVVNKPAGWVVHPAAGHWSGTLLNGVLAHHPGAATLPRAGIVHRLDKDTSGLMVLGKTLEAVTALVRAIAAREVHREYVALVHGRLVGEQFRVDQPVGRDPQSRIRMAIVARGKSAQTDVTPLATAELECGVVSAVKCKLHTGRTHQIRVHMAYCGHPLVADATYGGRPALGLVRQALHAQTLGFHHPLSGQWLCFNSVLAIDLAQAWKSVVHGSDTPP